MKKRNFKTRQKVKSELAFIFSEKKKKMSFVSTIDLKINYQEYDNFIQNQFENEVLLNQIDLMLSKRVSS